MDIEDRSALKRRRKAQKKAMKQARRERLRNKFKNGGNILDYENDSPVIVDKETVDNATPDESQGGYCLIQ